MKSTYLTIKKIILYLFSLVTIVLLLRYTYRDFSWQELQIQLEEVNIGWIILGTSVGLVGHLIKAYRWKLLLEPIQFHIGLLQSFQGLLAGYLSTLLLPKIGGLVRCSLLNRTTGIPLGFLLGTAVLERLLGGVVFLIIFVLNLLVSFSVTASIFPMLPCYSIQGNRIIVGIGSLLFIVLIAGYVLCKKYFRKLLMKVQPNLDQFKQGFTGICLSPIKQDIALLTLLEWCIYYVRDYISIVSLQGEESFSWMVGLSILTMSVISFSLPIQGGLGVYHLLVSSVLIAHGVAASSALLYVGAMHSTHFVGIFIIGLVVTLFVHINKGRRIES